jgi:hypothetical protein
MASTKDRQAKLKQARRDAGLVRLELWLRPEDKIQVKQLADQLVKKGELK